MSRETKLRCEGLAAAIPGLVKAKELTGSDFHPGLDLAIEIIEAALKNIDDATR